MEEGNEALFCKMSRGGWQGGRPHDDRYMSKMNKMNENKKNEQKQKGGRDLDSDLADGLEQKKEKIIKSKLKSYQVTLWKPSGFGPLVEVIGASEKKEW